MLRYLQTVEGVLLSSFRWNNAVEMSASIPMMHFQPILISPGFL